tara:strand:- start:735 stop:1436 length:702 start_codon:yes stop_codon:yes gene_type:complete
MLKDFKNYNDFDIVAFDYFYDMNDNYYKSIGRLKLKKITKQEYINATGESSFIIQKLKDSLYPYQHKDYKFLKYPDNYSNDIAGKYVPVDWKLTNIIKFLWEHEIITCLWDQGFIRKDKIDINGYITIKYTTNDDINVIPLLIKLFTQNNIVLLENPNIKSGTQFHEWCNKLVLQYPNKIRIIKLSTVIRITFNPKMIPQIYKFLQLEPVNKNNIHKGNRIISPSRFKLYKII